MIGIYKIENTINHLVYIGQSVDIQNRFNEHKLIPFRTWRDTYNYPLYQDMKKYGIDKFTFTVLEECPKENLNEKEQYYIQKYDSYNNGYNQTPGGDSVACGDLSNHHILTEEDVIDIRTRYNNKETRWSVYQLYKDKVKLDTFSHIWNGKTWKWVMPEVFTEENIIYHQNNLGEPNSVNKHIKMTQYEVRDIRQLKNTGKSRKEVYNKYSHKLSWGAFNAIWYNQSWKDIK